MDIPVKKLTRLLKPDQAPDVRAAAALVFAELGVKDAEASTELIARLDDESEAVRLNAIRAAGKLKIPKALPTLLERIKHGGEEANMSADSAARLGPEGIKGLQGLMHNVVPGVRRYIAAALSGAGSGGAEVGVSVLLDRDPQVAVAAATAIIGRIPSLPADRKSELADELVALAKNRKHKPAAELPIVTVLASLNEPVAAEALWEWTLPPHAPEVRSAALRAVGGWIETPTKDQWRRLFACASDSEFRVAAPALSVLGRLNVSDKQLDEWVKLFHAPDMAARRLAMEKIGNRDTADVAEGLMAQLTHPDRGLREAARNRLAKIEHGRKALAAAVLAAPNADELWPLARSVAPFVGSFPDKLRKEIFTRASKYLDVDDHRADPLLFLLREADAHALRDLLFEQGVARRKKKDYEVALKFLKLLARDPAAGFPMRLELALCGLKQSSKDMAPDSRGSDPTLRQFEHVLEQNADEVLKEIGKSKWLDADDLYYLGFHFAERFNKEKEFGVEVLKQVVKVSPRSKVAAAAKNKLKSVSF